MDIFIFFTITAMLFSNALKGEEVSVGVQGKGAATAEVSVVKKAADPSKVVGNTGLTATLFPYTEIKEGNVKVRVGLVGVAAAQKFDPIKQAKETPPTTPVAAVGPITIRPEVVVNAGMAVQVVVGKVVNVDVQVTGEKNVTDMKSDPRLNAGANTDLCLPTPGTSITACVTGTVNLIGELSETATPTKPLVTRTKGGLGLKVKGKNSQFQVMGTKITTNLSPRQEGKAEDQDYRIEATLTYTGDLNSGAIKKSEKK